MVSVVALFRQTGLKPFLVKRAKIIQAVRSFFIEEGFLEVDTPVRIPYPLPESHIDAETSGDWYLQASPESCMKQLLATGFPQIFQICKCFRKGERGRRHLPEMTLLEWYEADVDYKFVMDRCQALVRFAASTCGPGDFIAYQGRRIDLTGKWERLTVADAFKRYASITMEAALAKGRFDECMALEIEPSLGNDRPVFLYDYPLEKGALAKASSENPQVAERFELYIAGLELCNAFSELTDAAIQENRFDAENSVRMNMGKPGYAMPMKFLEALKGMPEAGGIALGMDRLVMLLTDAPDIDHVTAFVPEDL